MIVGSESVILLIAVFTIFFLTHYWNGDFVIWVGKSVVAPNFNPKVNLPVVILLKIFNQQGTVLLFDLSHQFCSTLILLQNFRLSWMIDNLVLLGVPPNPCEACGRLSRVWVVIRAGDHHAWTKETLYLVWDRGCPTWCFCLRNCNKLQNMMRWSTETA